MSIEEREAEEFWRGFRLGVTMMLIADMIAFVVAMVLI